jgi:DNA-binding FadR family transcriptional regulator
LSVPTSEPSRSDAIAADLRDAILRGDHAPGERLPAERELAAKRSVGRSTVREAVAKLAQLGLVEIRHGGGATVRPLEDANLEILRHLLVLSDEPDLRLLGEFMDVQELLLASLVRLAIERATEAELERAHALLERMTDPAGGDAEYFDSTEALVQLIAEASRHLVLRLVRNGLRAILNDEGRRGHHGRLRPSRDALIPIVGDLHAAIDARDADAAVDAVRKLVHAGREQFLKRIEARRARTR